MQKKILIGIIVAIIVIIGGVYFYSTQPASITTSSVQNSIDLNSPNQKNLQIISSESKATYEINEKLQGKPTHVTGVTQSIEGSLKINTASPASIQIGEIKIDAMSFKTDIAKRDENVNDLVLKSNKPENRYISFTPVDIALVPANIEIGKDFPIEITGNMKILGIIKPAIFKGTANLSSDNSLIINATSSLTYGDFGITIPDFSFLSDVDKSVTLTVSLVAR